MRHAAHAPLSVPVSIPASRHARRWRRMRARLGFVALWAALLVWVLGASVRVPGEEPALAEVARQAAPAELEHAGLTHAGLTHAGLAHVDLERAAAWPGDSAEASMSQEPAPVMSYEPTPEQDAALYIAGR